MAVKGTFEREIDGIERAIAEMAARDLLGPVPVTLVTGPDEYLFGEEKALLEVIEGNEPLPRVFPPFRVGLFARRASVNPTLVNNVETLAHVPLIVENGVRFRSRGDAGIAAGRWCSPCAVTSRAPASTSSRWVRPCGHW